MIIDKNKNIESITYNHLNLPKKITFVGNNRITYIYNALGVKLRKEVVEADTQATTHYMGTFQYNNNNLQYIHTSEGYVRHTPPSNSVDGALGAFDYVYNYTDHLGNIRLSYTLDPSDQVLKILEENHYYPFGMKHSYNTSKKDVRVDEAFLNPNVTPSENGNRRVEMVSNTGYQYKYQGQERQDELGLGWDSFKWRNYDYAIGRFMSIDPLSEKYAYQSHYNFAENRVVDGNELEGLEWVNAENQQIYDPNKNDGKGDYTEYASKQDIYLGNALKNSSATGAAQFDKLVNSSHPIEVKVYGDTIPVQPDGSIEFGSTITPKENNSDGKSTITLNTASINYLVEVIEENSKTGGDGAKVLFGEDDVTNMNFKDILAATFGEEVEHTTDENISLQHSGASRDKIEEKPSQISSQIFQEISQKKKP